MKFAHLSDSHLGYHSYRKLTSEGYNQREEDIREALVRVIDRIIDIKPDLCIHSGDLFDSPRPSNRNITLAIEGFLRLTAHGISVVVISGNHETPKTRQLGHVFGVFEFFDDLHPIYRPQYQVIRLGRVAVHAIPQCPSASLFEEELKKLSPSKDVDYNVLILHAAIASIPEFSRGDFNEQFVEQSCFRQFDWVALGHYHGFAAIQPNAAYAGSTERLSFAEARQPKGFAVVDVEKREALFVDTGAREMVETVIDSSRLTLSDINKEIQSVFEGIEPGGKIVKLKIEGADSSVSKLIDFRKFFALTKDAVHSAVEVVPGDEEAASYSPTPQLSKLSDEFKFYLEQLPKMDTRERLEIENLGLYYLSLVEETESE
jgi:DNA repair exonuclease SbcCD nuclease subunit